MSGTFQIADPDSVDLVWFVNDYFSVCSVHNVVNKLLVEHLATVLKHLYPFTLIAEDNFILMKKCYVIGLRVFFWLLPDTARAQLVTH